MVNIILIVVLLAAVGGAAWYIHKAKKSGNKCIGCPYSGSCSAAGCSQGMHPIENLRSKTERPGV